MHSRNSRNLIALLVTIVVLAMNAATSFAQEETAATRYEDARGKLRDGAYREAASLFDRIERDDPDGEFAARSLYWKAFALQREGGRSNLREAAKALELQFERFPEDARRGDSRELAVRIQSDLASLGDAEAAARIAELADRIREGGRGEGVGFDDETRIAALNALMHMDPDRAMPIVRKILVEKPENYSDTLREKALFIASQNDDGDGDAVQLLTHVIAHDSSPRVREQAVFWLSQTEDDAALEALTSILRNPDESPEIREKAIFAISQVGDARALSVLRDVAVDAAQPEDVRAQAVFWISQSGGRDSVGFLTEFYRSTDDRELRDKAIFALSQIGGPDAASFLLSVVRDDDEDTEMRKQALFWLGQSGDVDEQTVIDVFTSIQDEEVRDQAVFVLSQMDTPRSIEALIRIAREADDRELRERAIFWLGQSDDERAVEFLTGLLEEEF